MKDEGSRNWIFGDQREDEIAGDEERESEEKEAENSLPPDGGKPFVAVMGNVVGEGEPNTW